VSEKLPTEKELQVLRVLWRSDCAMTVEEVRGRLQNGDAYTTVQTTMTRMVDKGLLTKSKVGKALRFSATNPSATTKDSMLRRFLSTVFGGSAQSLVADLLDHGHLTAEELQELQARTGGEGAGGAGKSGGEFTAVKSNKGKAGVRRD